MPRRTPASGPPARAVVATPFAVLVALLRALLRALLIALAVGPAAVHAQAPAAAPRPRHTAADARFVRDMIGHHGQALAMSALAPARARRAAVRTLAERIEVSQRDEMALMRRWLTDRGEAAPDSAGAADEHAEHAAHMPGMLTPAQLAELGRARGDAFDRLFLAGMIRHHEGALTMVAALFAAPGAAQESELFRLASDVDADQRAEIARMRALLRTLPNATGGR